MIKTAFSIYCFFALCFSTAVLAQDYATLKGRISDENGKPLELVNIAIQGTFIGTNSDKDGFFALKIPAGNPVQVVFTFIGYTPKVENFNLSPGQVFVSNVKMESETKNIPQVDITDKRYTDPNLQPLDPKVLGLIPDPSGGIEAIIKTQIGVFSRNELSSQYSVRGGSFDENLVYVNDIEVYRPFLTRSGEQEGLSFVNTDMVSSILFSSGGFDARFGDKMSSVLDIRYRKPTKFAGAFSASLLGGSAAIEGCSKNHRFTHITGIRYKSSQYVLSSLDVKGEYKPAFSDIQTYLTYDLNEEWELSFLGNYASNSYTFIPVDRETSFGTINEALKLKIYFDGQELDKFNTATGALSLFFKPTSRLKMKFIASAFNTAERETFDISGQYYLNELDKQLGSDNMGDSLMNIGVGTFLYHARNYLDATVMSGEYKSSLLSVNKKNNLQWGLKFQHEIVEDRMREWQMRDSAGYSIPYTDSVVSLAEVIIAKNNIESNRITSFIQDSYTWAVDSAEFSLATGVRGSYWDFNEQFLLSPRLSVSFKPHWKRDIYFRFACGYYYQPPFYKELRDLEGHINTNIKAQESVHFVAGGDYYFKAWNRPFKFVTEVYYKLLDHLIPYQIDNVRIRYYATNNAHGYAEGIDMKINGEFVKGVDSWASLSFLKTQEDIADDFYYETDDAGNTVKKEPGYIPRPTDQRVNFGLFFQDYLPRFPSWKVQLSLMYGSGIPYGPPGSDRFKATLRMPPYRRVDIGFSKVIKGENKELPQGNPLRHFKSIWITAEVFNLLDINNTVSYVWVSDIRDRQYAVPNYLSSRRINVRLILKF